jgi:Rha family phage regulatory protein
MSRELLNQIDFRAFVMANHGQPVTTSLKVAEAFGKQHKDVLRAIQRIECSKDFTERNFAPSEYVDSTGRKLPMFNMTKDGFVFLVMGFTGRQASKFKEAYIEAFNWMQDVLIQQGFTLAKRHNFLSLKFDNEKSDASVAGRCLRQWRDAKSNFLAEFSRLETEMQPMLNFFESLEDKKALSVLADKQGFDRNPQQEGI